MDFPKTHGSAESREELAPPDTEDTAQAQLV